MKRALSGLLLIGCVLVLLWGALTKANYWREEKTLETIYRAITMCKQIEHALAIRGTDGPLPPPAECLADLVAGHYVSDSSAIDPWGSKPQVRLSTNGDLHVWSLGPDGVSLSPDDLSADSPAVHPHSHGGYG